MFSECKCLHNRVWVFNVQCFIHSLLYHPLPFKWVGIQIMFCYVQQTFHLESPTGFGILLDSVQQLGLCSPVSSIFPAVLLNQDSFMMYHLLLLTAGIPIRWSSGVRIAVTRSWNSCEDSRCSGKTGPVKSIISNFLWLKSLNGRCPITCTDSHKHHTILMAIFRWSVAWWWALDLQLYSRGFNSQPCTFS